MRNPKFRRTLSCCVCGGAFYTCMCITRKKMERFTCTPPFRATGFLLSRQSFCLQSRCNSLIAAQVTPAAPPAGITKFCSLDFNLNYRIWGLFAQLDTRPYAALRRVKRTEFSWCRFVIGSRQRIIQKSSWFQLGQSFPFVLRLAGVSVRVQIKTSSRPTLPQCRPAALIWDTSPK